MKKSTDLIMTGPPLSELGGVAVYSEAIIRAYPGIVSYLPVPMGAIKRPLLVLKMLMDFTRLLASTPGRVPVHINSNMIQRGLWRDMVLGLLTLLFRHPIIFFFHGWEIDYVNSLGRLQSFLLRVFLRRCWKIVVLSKSFRETLLKRGITDVYVETSCISPDIEESQDGITFANRDPLKLLFIGRVVKEKGVFELVSAVERLKKTYPNIRLVVAGDGPDAAELVRDIERRSLGFVEYVGRVSGLKKKRLMASCGVFCLPSYHGEGLPIAMLDAMWMGMPVIVTEVGGIPENISAGKNGFFVRPKDVDSIVSSITKLFEEKSLYDAMCERNQLQAKARYSAVQVARRLALLNSGNV